MNDPTSRFLPLNPDTFEILLALAQDELHGYAMLKELESRGIHIAASLLYRKLKRLMEDDLVAEVRSRVAQDDPRRRYYRLTTRGRAVLQGEAARIVELARNRDVRALAAKGNHA
jgi:DNA-binding PadR family transcriptional regulator